MRASCFVTAYELIKADIVDSVHDFLCPHFDEDNTQHNADYQRVLSQEKGGRYEKSLCWLVEAGALTSAQADLLGEIKQHRNQVTHELPNLLLNPDLDVRIDLLDAALDCLRSLGYFWGSITMASDAQWDHVEVDPNDVTSGAYLLMKYLTSIASSFDE